MTVLLVTTHLLAILAGAFLFKAYSAKAFAEAQEAKTWAESELANFKAAAAKDLALLKAKLPGGFR